MCSSPWLLRACWLHGRERGTGHERVTIPNQSSIAMAFREFDEAGRMRPSSYYDRIVNVMEELVRFTVLTRGDADQLFARYSERKATRRSQDAIADLATRSTA
jgi:arsenical resistance protein ArsH